MTNAEALERLQARETFLNDKLAALQSENRNAYWTERDIEANDLAMAALEYVASVEEYESSQVPR
jgi:hypothetical protein